VLFLVVGLLRPVEAVLEVLRSIFPVVRAICGVGHDELLDVEALHLLEKLLLYEFFKVEPVVGGFAVGVIAVVEQAGQVLLALLLKLVLSLHEVTGPFLHEAESFSVFLLVVLPELLEGRRCPLLRCLFNFSRGEAHSNNN
jgi:hypothetical protein